MKTEEQQVRDDLIARYGEVTFNRALEMSGLRLALQALATDVLSKEERLHAYVMAGMHLAKLQSTFLTPPEWKSITECAKRMDAALDTWMLDELEARDGLPPAPCL